MFVKWGIAHHPATGTIILCDFSRGFRPPEMVKRRPVLVVSPKITARPGLCTIVALSTKDPDPVLRHHCKLAVDPVLPAPWDSPEMWIKGDMVYAVALERLDLIREGRTLEGARRYRKHRVSPDQLRSVRTCILEGLGLGALTRYL